MFRRTLQAIAAASLTLSLAGCAVAVDASPVHDAPKAATPIVTRELGREISFAAYGDSISAWNPPFAGDPAQSWTLTTSTGYVRKVDGWALPGAKLDAIEAHAAPTKADFVIVMGGTNDVYYGTPIAQRLAEIDTIVRVSQARRVIISAVAPYGFNPALGTEWNDALRAHAASEGWAFIDPWLSLRTAGDGWAAGASRPDHIHPTPASAAVVGAVIRADLVAFSKAHKLPSSAR